MTSLSQQMSDAVRDYAEDRREIIRENPITMTIAAMAIGAALGVTMRKRA